jgi:hypothetical protein
MIQVVLIIHGTMIVYLPFDSCHYIKAHSMLVLFFSLSYHWLCRIKQKIIKDFTDLSTDVGVVHNHFDKDERGWCWIIDDPLESKFVISISESMNKKKQTPIVI